MQQLGNTATPLITILKVGLFQNQARRSNTKPDVPMHVRTIPLFCLCLFTNLLAEEPIQK